ncbi:site-specific DNA-methyltransferase [Lactiplantibacillus plajomi]|uniref:Site-specific DNA-methyltransferase n=1 Tax=Lactiplantibacillus plajomi TaxID=1457217 RepID=A0ABV6K4B2_9LACO|nr:site-specific DNA-methyltransferase [Lactiplantibacillus plajomi]
MNENKFDSSTLNFRTSAAEKIAKLFPSVINDGKINFDKLQEILSPDLEEMGNVEKYDFTWRGKGNAKLEADAPSEKTTLIANKSKSKNWEDTENVYIEGDNLEVLKLLQKSYEERVQVIYVDPPYNTGNDYIYHDDYHDGYEHYLRETGQIDEDGNSTTTNKETSGRFHTDWLNMMYPRLKLSRRLLKDSGVIFVSIDNNEIKNLYSIMDEIFGENNRIGIISNTNNPKGRSDDKFIATAHEYIIVYAKNIAKTKWYGFEPTEKITRRYNKTDKNDRKYREIDLRKTGEKDLREDRPKMFYYFYYNKNTGDLFPSYETNGMDGYIQIVPKREDGKDGRWRWGIETAKSKINKLLPKFMPTRKIWGIMEKDYLDERTLVKPTSSWTFTDVNSERGTEQFMNLGFNKEDFEKPKPVGTIKRCINLGMDKSDNIVLDFFAGSATTAQAVMELNSEDKGSRKYILVQLPEKTKETSVAFKDGYVTIPEVSEERIRRAGDNLYKAIKSNDVSLDTGFRVYELKRSTINRWDQDPQLFTQQLTMLPFTDESTNDQRALEIALKSGIRLNISPKVDGDNYHFISDDKEIFVIFGEYSIALMDKLNIQRKLQNAKVVLKEMDNGSPEKFNLIELLKQDSELNNHFSLEWI